VERLKDRDLLSALVLFIIGLVALSETGGHVDDRNWTFPSLAIYVVLAFAAMLLLRVVIAAVMERVPDVIRVSHEDRPVFIDVAVFCAIVLAYLFVMYGLGFWLSSFLMLSLASIYLTADKTRRNLGFAVVVPLATCVLAYFVFMQVFYVPVPKAGWWPGFG
jgi:hypothetical protein